MVNLLAQYYADIILGLKHFLCISGLFVLVFGPILSAAHDSKKGFVRSFVVSCVLILTACLLPSAEFVLKVVLCS